MIFAKFSDFNLEIVANTPNPEFPLGGYSLKGLLFASTEIDIVSGQRVRICLTASVIWMGNTISEVPRAARQHQTPTEATTLEQFFLRTVSFDS
jgi:hypothetical protein